MAEGGYQFDIKDQASVNEWKARAEKLNAEADRITREAAQALQDFGKTAEGNVFEEVVKYSDGVITGMTDILKGMNEILTVVNSIMEKILNFGKGLVDGMTSVANAILG